jgi:autotransporter-associated beta strand protein
MKPKSTLRSFLLTTTLAVISIGADTALAQSTLYSSGAKTWDANPLTLNWGTVSGGPYDTSFWTSGDNTIFEGTAGIVTLGEAITIGNLNVNTANYKITGSTLAFTGGITVSATGVTIESGITGSPNVNQTGGNNLVLNPTSTNMSLNQIIRDADNYLYLRGTTTGNTLGFITKSAAGGNVPNQKLYFDGTGKWTLLGNVYAGEMYIKSGEVVANGELSADYSGIFVQNTGVLHYNHAGAVKGPTNGSSSTLKFYIDGGSIDNTSGAAITTSTWNPRQQWRGNWIFIGSNGSDSNLNLGNGAVGLSTNVQVTVQNAATTLSATGSVSDAGGGYGITKAGPGTLALSGSHNYLGATTVSAGTLSLGDGTNNSNLSDSGLLEIATGATLNANWDAANVDTVFALTFNGSIAAAGTWGRTGHPSAQHTSAQITGDGLINNLGGLYTDGSFFWDGPLTGGTGNGVSNGGNGTWDTTTNDNWDKGFTAREAWTNNTASKAIFGGTKGTVTLGSDITLGELTISSTAASGYKFQGQTLNFGGAKSLTVAKDGVTIESGITGSPNVNQTGGNNLVLNPTSANMSLNQIIRDADNYLYLRGTTTGNTLGFITKSAAGGNVQNQKLTFDGSGKWTLLGNVYGGEMYIKSGEVVANGELSGDFNGIFIQNTGVLHWNNPGAVKGPSNGSSSTLKFKIQGGSIDNTSGSAITTSTWNPRQEWGGNWTFIGSNGANSNLYLGNGAVGLSGARQVTVQNAATTLSVGGIISGSGFGLTKAGDGTLELRGANTYNGATMVTAGTLALTGGSQASAITVQTGAKLGLSPNTGSPATATTTSSAALTLDGGHGIKIIGSVDNSSDYLLMSASSISGSPVLNPTVSNYTPELRNGNTELWLKYTGGGGGTAYQAWATGNEPFDGDANGDGVKDGLAFLLGAANPSENAIGRLPTVTQSGGGLVLNFNCLPIAARGTATLKVAHSNNLASWTTTTNVVPDSNVPDAGGVVSYVIVPGSPLNNVTATIGSGAAAGGKLFGRLEATE